MLPADPSRPPQDDALPPTLPSDDGTGAGSRVVVAPAEVPVQVQAPETDDAPAGDTALPPDDDVPAGGAAPAHADAPASAPGDPAAEVGAPVRTDASGRPVAPANADAPASADKVATHAAPGGNQAPASAGDEAASEAPAADARRGDCTALLKQRFPALFAGTPKPIKLRIQTDIQQRAPGVFGRQALSAFLRRHTGSTGYLIAITRSRHRYDLDGQPSGEISAEHRQAAADELARRRELHRAKIEQAEEGRRSRAALLRDYERTTLTRPNFCALKGIAPEALDALLQTAREEASQPPPQQPQQRPHPGGEAGRPREAPPRPPAGRGAGRPTSGRGTDTRNDAPRRPGAGRTKPG